jgi:protein-disulfide isomerase
MSDATPSRFGLLPMLGVGLLAGIAGAAAWDLSGLGQGARDEATQQWLLENPEMLRDMASALQSRDIEARIAPLRGRIETAYPGAVLGNPNGTVTLVEFSDYACGFCRQSVPDVAALVAANPDLKVVVHEYPILTPESADAARMALAAADQGKFAAFHNAMFAAGRPDAETIAEAAQRAGVDLAAARAAIESGKYEQHLAGNHALAGELGFSGTPSWVIGSEAFSGAVGHATLNGAILRARDAGEG